MKISDIKISTRLLIGFSCTIILTILLGMITIRYMFALAGETNNIYHHPLAVSNAVRDIHVQILGIHRDIKGAVIAKNEVQLDDLREEIQRRDEIVEQSFKLIYDRFLGDMNDVKMAHQTYQAWTPMRDKVFTLLEKGNRPAAAEYTINEVADYVDTIEDSIKVMSDFAQNKADSFFNNSKAIARSLILTAFILLILIVVVSTVVGIVIVKSITQPVTQIVEAIENVSQGHFDEIIQLDQKDEIGLLADTFDKMTSDLKVSTISIEILNEEIRRRERVENELLASQENLRNIQKMAHLGHWRWDVKTGDVFWSDEVYDIFHLNPEEFTPQIDSVMSLSPWPEYRKRHEELMEKAIKEHQPGAYEQKFIMPNGDIGFYYSTFQGVYDENDELIEMTGTVLDITKTKLNELELELSNSIADVFLAMKDDRGYNELLNLILKCSESEYGVFGYIDEDGSLVCPTMTWHIWDECKIPDKQFIFPRENWGDSSWPIAIREKRIICSNEPALKVPQGHVKIDRQVAVPIIYLDEVIGLIQVANKTMDYDQHDVNNLEFIADRIAPILSSRLINERQEAKRSETEAALRISEERFRTTLDNMIEGGQIINFDWEYIYINHAAELHNRRPKEEMIGKHILDCWPGYDQLEVYRMEKRCMEERIPLQMENEFVFPDGSVGVYDLRFQPISEGIFILSIDITERKKAEDSLRESEEEYRELVESVNSIIVRWAPDGRITFMNTYGLEFFGYEEEEVVGQPVVGTIVAETDRAGRDLAKMIDDIVKYPEQYTSNENENTLKNGQRVWIRWANKPVYDERAELVEVMAVGQDATAQKLAEQNLSRIKERFRLALENTPDMVVIYDTDLKIQYINPPACQFSGLSENEFIGKTVEEIHPPEVYNTFLPALKESLNSKTVADFETEITINNNTSVVRIVCVPILNTQGQVQEILGLTHDLTERIKAEKEREGLIGDLEAKNAELERFTYTASHDLKSPLVTIKGFLGMLRQDMKDQNQDNIDSDMSYIDDAVDKMYGLLEDLLELSRIGRVVNPSEEISIQKLTADVLQLLESRIQQKNVDVIVQPDLPVVLGDWVRLREVYQNLIENAIKYMGKQDKPRVEIGFDDSAEQPYLYIQDNGPGIDPQYHQRIFDLFDRLDQEQEGSGVGLAIVKRIIEHHGGKIWVESDGQSHGSRFCFTVESLINAKSPVTT